MAQITMNENIGGRLKQEY